MDMKSTMKTRVQRRVEKKQVVLLVTLVLVIAVVSFALGVIVGRNRVAVKDLPSANESTRISVPISQTPTAEKEPLQAKAPEEKLSFYDNLSKAEPAPLGSGINLPPDNRLSSAEKLKTEKLISGSFQEVSPAVSEPAASNVATASAKVDSSPTAKKSTPPAELESSASSKPQAMPSVVKGGEWVVQVFSSQSAADAGILRDKLSAKGYPAYIAEADLGKKGLWYRVLFGPYLDKNTAVQAQSFATSKDKLKGFVKHR
ncbi:SPOR domain-containing protein [Geopsychrobacter electrodiphilus]|uniref:SPOR domain-containing protein n=1 Tax=Geopsychrobacter electrodiphilus TaxID=225196 RepID=UPI000364C32E|nr:SPOR domain-containing protein [Geopsychrobacter electrodiphilus]